MAVDTTIMSSTKADNFINCMTAIIAYTMPGEFSGVVMDGRMEILLWLIGLNAYQNGSKI